jgi:hypothetical protein
VPVEGGRAAARAKLCAVVRLDTAKEELLAKTRTSRSGRRPARKIESGESKGFGEFKEIPERLTAIEVTLKKVLRAVTPRKPSTISRTRLLFPIATNTLGFETSIAVANTGQDSSGVIGKAGICTLHYFGQGPNGNPPSRRSESTNRPVNVGETITLVLSTGGALGLQGNPNFQGYVEVDCDFPFAHGWAFLADGPIGQARVATTIPALVLPNDRRNQREESTGQ